MSQELRDWLLGLLAAALLGVLCHGLAGEDRPALRLTTGLVLLLVLCSPVVSFDLGEVSQILTEAREEAQMAVTGIEVRQQELLMRIISEKTQTYILDKAQAMGMALTVSVEVVQGADYPYPAAVTLTGRTTAAQRQVMNQWIRENLAIAEENVMWNEADP